MPMPRPIKAGSVGVGHPGAAIDVGSMTPARRSAG